MDKLQDLFQQCLDKSYYYENVDNMDMMIAKAMDMYKLYMTDVDIDQKWPEENNDVSNKVDGFFINANIMSTKDEGNLFSIEDVKDQEYLIQGDYDESMEKVPPLDHNLGVKMTTLSTHVSELYEKCLDTGMGIEDVDVGTIRSMSKNLTSVEWFERPTTISIYDNKRSAYIRRIWRELNKNMREGDSLLSIGGDACSASKRQVKYKIDCLYFDQDSYDLSVKNRSKSGCRGKDYLYGRDFDFDLMDPNRWKICTFNYYGEQEILNLVHKFFFNTDCFVYGINCSPCWEDSECVYSTDEYSDKDLKKLPYDKYKAKVYSFQILGKRGNKVAVYNTHGRFEDVIIDYKEDWLYRVPIQYLHYVLPNDSDYPYLHSLMHTSLYFIETQSKGLGIGKVKFPILNKDMFDAHRKIYSFKKGTLFDENGNKVMSGYPVDLNTQLLVYDGPKCKGDLVQENEDNVMIPIDINREGNYYERMVYIKKLGFRLYNEGNVETTYKRNWNDGMADDSFYAIQYLEKHGNSLYDEVRLQSLLGVFNGTSLPKVFNIHNEDQVVRSLISLTNKQKYFELHKDSLLPYLVVYGVTYNPILNDLVLGSGYKSYLFSNKFVAHQRYKESFSNDKLFNIYVDLFCSVHDQSYELCEDMNIACEEKCNVITNGLKRNSDQIDAIVMCLIPAVYAYNVSDVVWIDKLVVYNDEVVDIEFLDVDWDVGEDWN